MKMHNNKLSSIKLTISTHKSGQWLFLNNHHIVLTDTGSNGGVGHLVLAVVREYFYYWSG